MVGKKALKFSLLKSCLDLFKAIGVKKDDNIRYNIKTIMDEKKHKLTNCIFFTPDVHKIINSLSSLCLNINIVNDNKKERGINFGAIPKRFRNEYLK